MRIQWSYNRHTIVDPALFFSNFTMNSATFVDYKFFLKDTCYQRVINASYLTLLYLKGQYLLAT